MKFRELLKMKNITQEELAKKLKITQQAISAWCCEGKTPKLKQICKIAEALDVSEQDVFNCFK